MALCNSFLFSLLCKIHLPSFFPTPLLLYCLPVATGTDIGWLYLFLRDVQPFSVVLFHLSSTSQALKRGMIKALSHLVSFAQIVLEASFFVVCFLEIHIQQAAGFEEQQSDEFSLAMNPWGLHC